MSRRRFFLHSMEEPVVPMSFKITGHSRQSGRDFANNIPANNNVKDIIDSKALTVTVGGRSVIIPETITVNGNVVDMTLRSMYSVARGSNYHMNVTNDLYAYDELLVTPTSVMLTRKIHRFELSNWINSIVVYYNGSVWKYNDCAFSYNFSNYSKYHVFSDNAPIYVDSNAFIPADFNWVINLNATRLLFDKIGQQTSDKTKIIFTAMRDHIGATSSDSADVCLTKFKDLAVSQGFYFYLLLNDPYFETINISDSDVGRALIDIANHAGTINISTDYSMPDVTVL